MASSGDCCSPFPSPIRRWTPHTVVRDSRAPTSTCCASGRGHEMKPLRIAALAAALIALLVIGIRPSWRVGATAHDAVLMTPGAEQGTSQRLADSLGGAPLFA